MRYNRLKPVRICCHKAAKIRDELIFRIYDLRFKISHPLQAAVKVQKSEALWST